MILPDGWTYDKDSNEFVLGNTEDFWTVEEGFLVRNHVVSRDETFQWDRDLVATCPVKIADLQPYKITVNNDNPESMMVEEFNAPSRNLGRDPWLGATVFPLRNVKGKSMEHAMREHGQESQEDQGQGNIQQGRE